MIYILIFIMGCLLIKMSNLNKMIKIYKNNYFTTLKILGEYDPKLKEYLERSNNRREDTILEQRQKISDLEDNWNKLKESIDIKLYNTEYLQKLWGYKIDDEIHMVLDIIKKEIKELEAKK